MNLRLLSVFLLLAAASYAQTTPAVWTPELQIKTRAVGSPALSPDGTRVVYTISDPVMTADRSEYVSQIWMATADGKENYQITFADKSSTNPKWSPDGRSIAFTSSRKDGKNNLYLLRLNGGEAEPLTDLKSSVGNFVFSPDGRWIAYSMSDAKTDDEEKNDKSRNDFRWVDENTKMSQLYIIPVEKDTDGKRSARKITIEGRTVSNFDWSPDGKTIAVSHVSSPVANFWPTADVALVDVATAKITPLAATEAAEDGPLYSPDGKWIAVGVSDVPVRWAGSGKIALYPTAGGAPRLLAASFDAQPNVAGWSADGKKIYFTEAKGTLTGWYELDTEANTIREPLPAQSVISALAISRRGDVFAAVGQTPTHPPELYVGRLTDKMPMQVSRANANAARLPLPKTEVVKWKSKDGREIEGLLTYPLNYQAGTKVPLILNIHGGPAGVFQQTFIGGRGVYPIAVFAQKGYAILRANPRGSSGYGSEFRHANIKDWGGMDYQDLMTGVDHVIAMGVADPEKLGVMGWSYGGYMTSWIITQTKRFKAASAGAPVTNLMSFNGTADIPAFVPDYFGGNFWENPEIYAKHSAMFNIKGASTPTLIIHGDADIRVPISQGYELYNALKAQNVPTRMLVLPRQPHGPTEPRMQMAAMQANLDWFDKYLRPISVAGQVSGRRLLDSENHLVTVARNGDDVVFVLEAIRDFTEDRDSSIPLGSGWDFAGMRVDINNNNVVDGMKDIAFGMRQKTNIFCAQYLIHEMASTGCGGYPSKGRVTMEFVSTVFQERPHPVFTYRIPLRELNLGGGKIGLVFHFAEPREGQSFYPNRRRPRSFEETIQLDLSEL